MARDSRGSGGGGAGAIVLFPGPRGTSDERAISLLRTVEQPEAHPVPVIETVLATVGHTPDSLGLVPLENPLEGELAPVLDRIAFDTANVFIRETVVLVEQMEAFGLAPKPTARTVVSHPFVLALCAPFISRLGLASVTAASTADACRMVRSGGGEGLVAIAPQAVGESFGLVPATNRGLTLPEVRTRYALIGREVCAKTGDDLTLLVITPAADRSGSLETVLHSFSERSLDLTSLRSRPVVAGTTESHCFFIEVRGHVSDVPLREALSELLSQDARLRVLGAYPRWPGMAVMPPYAGLPAASVSRESDADLLAAALHPPAAALAGGERPARRAQARRGGSG